MQSLNKFRDAPVSRSVGIEIECLINNANYSIKHDTFYGFFYTTADGSISAGWRSTGIEFVSQPLTVSWLCREIDRLNKKFKWESNSSCGIHVHVSRKWLTEKRAKTIYDWMCSLSWDEMEELFGRTPNTYCRVDSRRKLGSSRYMGINTTNKDTIEFRMFSSGDAKWARYCVKMVEYLIDNANHLNIEAALAFRDMYN